jgi:hypothetical protein
MNPTLWWLPSQNGLSADAPQRQRADFCVRVTVRPVPEQISTLPCKSNGPLGAGVTFSGPLPGIGGFTFDIAFS